MTDRTIHFVSLGCPKNRVDTEVMLGVSGASGFTRTDDAADAEVIVVNTCGFIGEAKKESIDTIFELAEMKKHGACKKLVVTGCLSQRYSTDLETQMPEVDHFLGSSDMLKLGKVLMDDSAERMLVGNPADWVIRASDPRVITESQVSAYLKIAEGCNRTCAFCTIPEFRGKQRSRTEDDIVAEAQQLAAQGVVELCLISQDTVAYGRDLKNGADAGRSEAKKGALARMVARVAETPGIRWVRLFYLYPETLDDALVDLLANHPRVVPYVDMPLQHAADAMLRRMRRGHGIDRQKRVVERLRTSVPGLSFRTAFIVGHPGESDAEFEELCDFVKWAEFEHVGVFRYSDEESAKSFHLDEKVKPLTAANRYRKLMSLQRKISRQKNRRLIGTEVDVLVEGASEEHEFVVEGRHAGQAPGIDGKVFLSGDVARAGEIRRVRIDQASDYDLVGELLSAEDGASPAAPRADKRRKVALRVV
jgi:ribosomal protein S12 methylthiotransferase